MNFVDTMNMGLFSILIAAVIFIYPVLTIVQCWMNPDLRKGSKIGWTAFMAFSMLFLMAVGAFVYAFIHYKGYKKLIPAFLIVLIAFGFWKIVQSSLGLAYDVNVSIIEQEVESSELQEKLKMQIETLKNEGGGMIKGKEINPGYLLSAYLSILLQDGLTPEEHEKWQGYFDARHSLNEEDIRRLSLEAQKYSLESQLDEATAN